MKIWKSYGSEHSMNLVMIGRFKNTADAKEAHRIIEQIEERVRKLSDEDLQPDRFSSAAIDLLMSFNLGTIMASELDQFRYDVSVKLKDDRLILSTEESEVSAFLKIMMHKGAKVEVYSAHDYPESESGRGN